jgi:endonuclease-3
VPNDRKQQIDTTMRILHKRFQGKAESEKEDPFRSIVFTLLSARTRDSQTEIAYQKVIANYPDARALARATAEALEPLLQTIGLFRAKARHLVAMARVLVQDFGGVVPASVEKMALLPGVGRKTANCVMVYGFGKPAVCVDTHVHRIVNRLGWVRTLTPEKTELALRAVLPKRWWLVVNHTLIQFGRAICVPGRPKCAECPVRGLCAYKKKVIK